MPEFPRTAPVTVVVDLPSGAFEMVAEERDSAVVEVHPYDGSAESREQAERTQVGLDGDVLSVVVPDRAGGLFRLRSGSVRVQVRVPLDSSGRIKVASADVRCRGRYAKLTVGSASGDVDIAEAGDAVEIKTASGAVRLGATRRGRVRIGTASGDVGVGVRPGTGVWLDLNTVSGTTRNRLDPGTAPTSPGGPDLSLEVRTVSGDIEVRRAA